MKLAAFLLCISSCLLCAGFHLEADGVLGVSTTLLPIHPDLSEALFDYEQVLSEIEGLRFDFVVLDSLECEQRFGLQVYEPQDWEEVRRVLEIVLTETSHSMVLLLGGTRTLPRPVVELATDDGKIVAVKSDAWYVDFDQDNIVDAGYSVGRMASLDDDPVAVAKQLRFAISIHRSGGLAFHTSNDFSSETTPPLGMGPSCTDSEAFFFMMAESDLVFFWGHGNPTQLLTHDYELILDVESIERISLQDRHPVVIAFNPCHAGDLEASTPTFATEFTGNGAAAYVANTAAQGFTEMMNTAFLDALKGGIRIGPALFDAMRYSITDWPSSAPPLITSQQFVLYGDPSLRRQ